MTENQICCCGPSVWVKIIAWFQIIGSVLLIIENSLVLVATKEQLENADDAKNPRTGEKFRPYEIDELKAALSAVMVVTVLKLVLAALSFVMGIVLLHGALSRIICLIRAWMAYTIISTILSTIIALTQISKDRGVQLFLQIMEIILVIAIQVFCIRVVGIYKNEIDAKREPSQSLRGENAVLKDAI